VLCKFKNELDLNQLGNKEQTLIKLLWKLNIANSDRKNTISMIRSQLITNRRGFKLTSDLVDVLLKGGESFFGLMHLVKKRRRRSYEIVNRSGKILN